MRALASGVAICHVMAGAAGLQLPPHFGSGATRRAVRKTRVRHCLEVLLPRKKNTAQGWPPLDSPNGRSVAGSSSRIFRRFRECGGSPKAVCTGSTGTRKQAKPSYSQWEPHQGPITHGPKASFGDLPFMHSAHRHEMRFFTENQLYTVGRLRSWLVRGDHHRCCLRHRACPSGYLQHPWVTRLP